MYAREKRSCLLYVLFVVRVVGDGIVLLFFCLFI